MSVAVPQQSGGTPIRRPSTEFFHRVVRDSGTALAGLSIAIGAQLGLYKAMWRAGPLTSWEVAQRAGALERYVQEWLDVQVACEYVRYDGETKTYLLPDEHAAVLADPTAETYCIGPFTMLKSLYDKQDELAAAFLHGGGIDWEAHDQTLYEGISTMSRPSYAAALVNEWLPALDGDVVHKLERGAFVADVGCGYGYSTILMARAFPRSVFFGFDFHEPSIDRARQTASSLGMSERVHFDVATAQDFPGGEYELVTFFNSLHELGDPAGALMQAERALADDGRCMIVEPNVSGKPLEHDHPADRLMSALSMLVCLPTAMNQDGPYALGNHAGEEIMRTIAQEAGLHSWRLAARSMTSLIYDVGR